MIVRFQFQQFLTIKIRASPVSLANARHFKCSPTILYPRNCSLHKNKSIHLLFLMLMSTLVWLCYPGGASLTYCPIMNQAKDSCHLQWLFSPNCLYKSISFLWPCYYVNVTWSTFISTYRTRNRAQLGWLAPRVFRQPTRFRLLESHLCVLPGINFPVFSLRLDGFQVLPLTRGATRGTWRVGQTPHTLGGVYKSSTN